MSPEVRRKLEQLFLPEQWLAAIEVLESECGSNLPLIEKQGVEGIERVRCAALKLSGGSLEKLQAAVRMAQNDWRDVLVSAGFANSLTAHLAGERSAMPDPKEVSR
jgi:hypothetical protein